MLKELLKSEKDLHKYLKTKGFSTNYRKHKNENGVDVIAMKEGYVFNIEHKNVELRDNGTYRLSGEIRGDILVLSLPSGESFFWKEGRVSLTKTCRLISMLNQDTTGNS